MDGVKSIAVPVKRRAATKPRKAGHPSPPDDSSVAGTVGEGRKQFLPKHIRPGHSYRVGQRLRMTNGGRSISRVEAYCQVVALLPNEGGPLRYRVRSDAESFERVVDEIDLSPPAS